MNAGRDALEDMLVLILEATDSSNSSPSYFIEVTGSYARSAYGASLEELVSTPDPMRSTPISFPETRRSAAPLSVPKVSSILPCFRPVVATKIV